MDLLLWAGIAFLVSLGAGALGYTGIAGKARTAAKWLFALFMALALVLLLLAIIGIGLLA